MDIKYKKCVTGNRFPVRTLNFFTQKLKYMI